MREYIIAAIIVSFTLTSCLNNFSNRCKKLLVYIASKIRLLFVLFISLFCTFCFCGCLRKLFYVYIGLTILSCNCNNAYITNYGIYTRTNNLGNKEFRVSLQGQTANLVFLPSQGGLNSKDIYLRLVTNYKTISTRKHKLSAKTLRYNDTMLLLKHILDYMSRDYELRNLHCLKFDISSF